MIQDFTQNEKKKTMVQTKHQLFDCCESILKASLDRQLLTNWFDYFVTWKSGILLMFSMEPK